MDNLYVFMYQAIDRFANIANDFPWDKTEKPRNVEPDVSQNKILKRGKGRFKNAFYGITSQNPQNHKNNFFMLDYIRNTRKTPLIWILKNIQSSGSRICMPQIEDVAWPALLY